MDWFSAQSSFYLGESLLTLLRPLDRIWDLFFSEVSQRAGEVRITRNKPSVISRQPQELPHLLFGLGSRAGRNGCRLINLGMHLPMTQVKAQIPDLHPPNRTLLWVGH